jgi:hypothetical protein
MLKGAISRLVPTRTKDLISHVFIEHNERYDHRFTTVRAPQPKALP